MPGAVALILVMKDEIASWLVYIVGESDEIAFPMKESNKRASVFHHEMLFHSTIMFTNVCLYVVYEYSKDMNTVHRLARSRSRSR